jgi:hypothetical protein
LVPLPRYVAATIQSFPPLQAIKELSAWWILLWVPSLSWANSQATDWPAPRQFKTLEWPPAAADAFEATKVTQTTPLQRFPSRNAALALAVWRLRFTHEGVPPTAPRPLHVAAGLLFVSYAAALL